MSFTDDFQYAGKRVLVVGGATGMGAAAAELVLNWGAEVVVMDYAAVTLAGVAAAHLNLAEKSSIDDALAQIKGSFDVVFSCAGVADGTPAIERINYVGHRYLIDQLLAEDRLPRGSAICLISSAAGLAWETKFLELTELLDIQDFEEAAAWLRARGMDNYVGTKQAMCAYVAREALALLKRGIRINSLCPGPTDTPLAQAHKDEFLGSGVDFRAEAGVEASTALEQAYPLVFLGSRAAVAITGVNLLADAGWLNAGFLGTFLPATPIAEFLMGRPAPFEKQTA